MGDPPSKAEVLHALGHVVKGLSALFWGIPLLLIAYVQTARADWLEPLAAFAPPGFFGAIGVLPCLIISIIVCFALLKFSHFQKQERIWQNALNKAELFALINAGLCPFLFWWHRFPHIQLYITCVALLAMSCLIFLVQVNHVLYRLTAMLPDEILRSETRMFTSFNIIILNTVFVLLCAYLVAIQMHSLPLFLRKVILVVSSEGTWMVVFLVLLPLAITMSLIWKIKEMIFSSVFDSEH